MISTIQLDRNKKTERTYFAHYLSNLHYLTRQLSTEPWIGHRTSALRSAYAYVSTCGGKFIDPSGSQESQRCVFESTWTNDYQRASRLTDHQLTIDTWMSRAISSCSQYFEIIRAKYSHSRSIDSKCHRAISRSIGRCSRVRSEILFVVQSKTFDRPIGTKKSTLPSSGLVNWKLPQDTGRISERTSILTFDVARLRVHASTVSLAWKVYRRQLRR